MRNLFSNKKKIVEEWDGFELYDYDSDESEMYDEKREEPEYSVGEGDAYYEDTNYEDDDYENAYYEDTDYEDVCYEDDEAAWYEEVAPAAAGIVRSKKAGKRNNKRKKSFFAVMWRDFAKGSIMDRVITVTGIAVLILALVAGGLYIGSKNEKDSISVLADVGSQLDGISLVGEKGLMAVADAERARLAAAEIVKEEEKEEEQKDYDEEEYVSEVSVKMNLTSVKKDLKIKFTNEETGKLIANVPFSVSITKPNGKSETWEDDDMDGIIYRKDIDAGKYKVLINELAGEKYAGYTLPSEVQTVEVKKNIAYEKIDVSNEVKTEAEINVALEDTKINQTVVESTLNDTVTWVESTSVSETYVEVAKSNIPDPTTLAMSKSFLRTAKVSGGDAKGDGEASVPKDSVTVQGDPTLTLDETTATVYLTKPVTIKAKLKNAPSDAKISAESSDTTVATVSVKNKNVKITGVAEGEATITVKYTEDEQETTATCVVKVVKHPKDNTTEKLQDSDGKQLYVLEDGTYRKAVYADYYSASKFFVKGAVKYTGWQTIDGNVYFFTAAGEKVTGEQIIQGAKYNFASDGSLITGSGTLGIDVSKWNGTIDWAAVKNSGISYVIIRCGYRGSSQGMLVEDPQFTTNIKGAIDAGLKVGVYFFTQATDEIEAVEEASYVLEKIKNYKISYPVFLDVEPSGGRGDKIDVATRTAVCKAFCETIQRAGYTAGIYANKTWLNEKITTSALNAYKIWLAQYAATPSYEGRYDMWQYTCTGKVSGISGAVDLNLSYY